MQLVTFFVCLQRRLLCSQFTNLCVNLTVIHSYLLLESYLSHFSSMTKLKAFIMAALISFSASSLASDLAETPGAEVLKPKIENGQIDSMSGIIYSQIKGVRSNRAMRMSVMIPRNDKLKPAIIYFPGGGFTSADYEKFTEMRTALAKAGFVVAAAEYRVVPNKFPALLEDAKAAVRFLRAHAKEYGIDPNRIGVLGDSAGGYLSQMAGATNGEKQFDKGDYLDQSSDVQAVASLYGISDLRNIGAGFPEDIQKVHESPAVTEALLVNGPAFNTFPGASIESDPKKALDASPIGHVDGNEPPYLLMHGSADPLVSPVQSVQMYKALKDKNEDVRYVVLDGAKHGDLPWYQPNVINTVVDFFKAKLGAPKEALDATKTDQNANL